MKHSGDTSSDLPFLIRLLDDQDPAVHPVVRERIAELGGDISHDLTALGIEIDDNGKKRLSQMLAPGRRDNLRDEWMVPTRGAAALEDDWDSFENILRQISDFLHDGITLRPSLSDSLDLVVDEIIEDMPDPSADDLRKWLFVSGRYQGVSKQADAAQYYDLSGVIDNGLGNPTSLTCLYMLLGHRLGIHVDGCDYPGHFLARIEIDGNLHLVDCFHGGRHFDVEGLLAAHPEISALAQAAVRGANHLGLVLLRYVTELKNSLTGEKRDEDARLFKELAATLTV